MHYENRPFLFEPYTYGLILNLDWFQPYKHLAYSVGIIYLSILNLPSHVRNAEANTIIVGVLPGPHEPNNNKSIEVQLLKRFMNNQLVTKIPRPTEFQEDFDEFLTNEATLVGSVGNAFNPFVAWPPFDIGHDVPHNWTIDELKSIVLLPKHRTSRAFSDPEVLNLIKLYSNLYFLSSSDIEVTSSFLKYQHCSISSKEICGCNSRSSASSVVMALWDPQYLGPSPGSSTPGAEVRPAQIQFLVKHNVKIKGVYC